MSIIIPQVYEARPVYTWSVCSALTRDMLRNSFDPRVFTEKTVAHDLCAPAGLAAVCSANRPEGKQGDNQIIRTLKLSLQHMKFMLDSCEVGQLLCATLSQLEAEEDESFQEKTMGSTNSAVHHVTLVC